MSLLVCLFVISFCSSLSPSLFFLSLLLSWNGTCAISTVKKKTCSITSHIASHILKPVSTSWEWRRKWSKGVGIETKISKLMSRDYFPSHICKAGNGSSCCIRSPYFKSSNEYTGDENKEAKFIEIYVCILFLLVLLFCSRFVFSLSSVDSAWGFSQHRICATYLYNLCMCVCVCARAFFQEVI